MQICSLRFWAVQNKNDWIELLIKCNRSQIKNTNICWKYGDSCIIVNLAKRPAKNTPRTIWFSLRKNLCRPSAGLFDTRIYKRPNLSGCDDAASTVCTIRYRGMNRRQAGSFGETRVGTRRTIQHPVYTAARPRNVLCSLSYSWDWHWLHQQHTAINYSFWYSQRTFVGIHL